MNAFAALVRKDVVLYLSNRRALLVTLAAPILIAAFFGYVFGGPPRKMTGIPVAVVDLDQSALSKSIIADMKSDTSFDLREMAEPEAVRRVREGQVRAAAVIPPGFGRDAPRALFRPDVKKPEIVVHYDPSQATALPLVRGLLAQHVMTSVGREVFNFRNGMKTITDLRSQVEASTELDAERKRDLLGIFDSVERLQSHIGNGGSHASTRPQLHSEPSWARSNHRPPARGSRIAMKGSLPPMWCPRGHQVSMRSVKVLNTCDWGAFTTMLLRTRMSCTATLMIGPFRFGGRWIRPPP